MRCRMREMSDVRYKMQPPWLRGGTHISNLTSLISHLPSQRQINYGLRSHVDFLLHTNGPAVLLNYLLDDGKPYSGAALLRGEEWFEDALKRRAINSLSLICNGQPRASARHPFL